MRIRPAEYGDFAAVTALCEELGRAVVTDDTREEARAVFESQVVDPDAEHLVVQTDDGRIVGFLSLYYRRRLNFAAPQAWIGELIVVADARRGGLGRTLLLEAEGRARDRGCYELALETGYQRAEAHHLYRRVRLRDSGKFFRKPLA